MSFCLVFHFVDFDLIIILTRRECPCFDYNGGKNEKRMQKINTLKCISEFIIALSWKLHNVFWRDTTSNGFEVDRERVDAVLLRYHISWCYLFTIMRFTDFSITHIHTDFRGHHQDQRLYHPENQVKFMFYYNIYIFLFPHILTD